MDFRSILEGHVNEVLDKNTELSLKRMQICYECPLFSERFGGLCNSNLWLNPETGDVSEFKKLGYVNGCSCRLQAKTRLEHSKCPAKKW